MAGRLKLLFPIHAVGMPVVTLSPVTLLDISGVQEIVRKSSRLPAEKMKQGILNEVAAWRDGAPTDDACLLLVHVR